MRILRFDHVGITVRDLASATAFFTALGCEPEGPSAVVEGGFIDTVIGMSGARSEIVMLAVPGSDVKIELSSFQTLRVDGDPPALRANVPGLRNICFEVDDVAATADRLAAAGYPLVGGIGEWEGTYRMAYVRGPDEVVVSIAERIG